MSTEADTCRENVVPKLQAAWWDNDPHSIAEQRDFADGELQFTVPAVMKVPQIGAILKAFIEKGRQTNKKFITAFGPLACYNIAMSKLEQKPT